MSSPKQRVATLALPAVFAALIAAGAFMIVPMPGVPVPLVLQNMLAVLAGLLLGPWKGCLSVLLFLMLGALGFPVFSGGHGGLAWLAGPTGGYLAAYPVAAFVGGFISKGPGTRPRTALRTSLATVLAFTIILCLGAARLMSYKSISWIAALGVGILPFILGDSVKAVLAALIGIRLGPFVDRVMAQADESFTES